MLFNSHTFLLVCLAAVLAGVFIRPHANRTWLETTS